MASIRKRNGLWQVQVRRRKIGSTSKSFHKKTDAATWAKVQEALMQTEEWKPKHQTYSTIVGCYISVPHRPTTLELNKLL